MYSRPSTCTFQRAASKRINAARSSPSGSVLIGRQPTVLSRSAPSVYCARVQIPCWRELRSDPQAGKAVYRLEVSGLFVELVNNGREHFAIASADPEQAIGEVLEMNGAEAWGGALDLV